MENSVLRDVSFHTRRVDTPPKTENKYKKYITKDIDGYDVVSQAVGIIVSDPKDRFRVGDIVTTSIITSQEKGRFTTLNTVYDVESYR